MNNQMISSQIKGQAKEMYLFSLKKGSNLTHLRAKAFAIKSFALAIDIFPEQQKELLDYVKKYAESLLIALKENSSKSWL